MTHKRSVIVRGDDGLQGQIESAIQANSGEVTNVLIQLDTGQRIVLPVDALVRQTDDTYYVSLNLQEVAQQQSSETSFDGHFTLPIISEMLAVQKQMRVKGGVRLTKSVKEQEEIVDEPLMHEKTEVIRVSVNKMVDAPVDVRIEGNMYIIPVIEEVLVVEKRILLKEEIHIRKDMTEYRETQKVMLRKEYIDVERFEEDSEIRTKTS